jgi:hypothetical protein
MSTASCIIVCVYVKGTVVYVYIISSVQSCTYRAVEPTGVKGAPADPYCTVQYNTYLWSRWA